MSGNGYFCYKDTSGNINSIYCGVYLFNAARGVVPIHASCPNINTSPYYIADGGNENGTDGVFLLPGYKVIIHNMADYYSDRAEYPIELDNTNYDTIYYHRMTSGQQNRASSINVFFQNTLLPEISTISDVGSFTV